MQKIKIKTLESIVWDVNPKHCMSSFQSRSITYLAIILLFYHGSGFSFLVAEAMIIELLYGSIEQVVKPLALIGVISTGPIEESIFIVFYGIQQIIILLC